MKLIGKVSNLHWTLFEFDLKKTLWIAQNRWKYHSNERFCGSKDFYLKRKKIVCVQYLWINEAHKTDSKNVRWFDCVERIAVVSVLSLFHSVLFTQFVFYNIGHCFAFNSTSFWKGVYLCFLVYVILCLYYTVNKLAID